MTGAALGVSAAPYVLSVVYVRFHVADLYDRSGEDVQYRMERAESAGPGYRVRRCLLSARLEPGASHQGR